ncbi:MAG: thiolase family protein [Dehalococcoidia bacterium]|nr:thiolase family protein [Dehalococcoidia bacterium]
MVAPVAIVGVYQTKYDSVPQGKTLEEMIFFAVKSLLDNTGADIKSVDSIVTSSSDQIDGRAIPMMLTSGPAGAELKDLINTSGASEHALILAYLRIVSGVFDNALVVSWTKSSEIDLPEVENLSADPFYERDIGLTVPMANAMQVSQYVNRFNVPAEAAAQVVHKNRGNALNNPIAHLRKAVTVDEAMASRVLSWPLRELDVPPQSDGVCAMLLASEEKAHLFGKSPAWIKGVGWAADTYWIGDRELSGIPSLVSAARRAYGMAGITDPVAQLDVAELHDITSYHELMEYEALGFCGPGEGATLVKKGITGMNGTLPVNPSGGVLSSNPVFASGLARAAEAALQVMGKAEGRQVHGVKTALAQAVSGFAGQISSVFILGKE